MRDNARSLVYIHDFRSIIYTFSLNILLSRIFVDPSLQLNKDEFVFESVATCVLLVSVLETSQTTANEIGMFMYVNNVRAVVNNL